MFLVTFHCLILKKGLKIKFFFVVEVFSSVLANFGDFCLLEASWIRIRMEDADPEIRIHITKCFSGILFHCLVVYAAHDIPHIKLHFCIKIIDLVAVLCIRILIGSGLFLDPYSECGSRSTQLKIGKETLVY